MSSDIMNKLWFAFILATVTIGSIYPQGVDCVECYDQNGSPIGCNSKWYPVHNGVEYECICICGVGGGPKCTPLSSSSSSNSSGYSSSQGSGTDIRVMVASAVINGLFNALDRLINSPQQNNSTSTQSQSQSPSVTNTHELTPEEKAEIERKQAEYRKNVIDQVNRANDEYTSQISNKFEDQKEITLNDFKTKLVRSESVKTIKQLNCAARQSTKAAKMNCSTIDFDNLSGSAEMVRSAADFTSGLPDCPEIKINVSDVTPEQPVGFQQVFYQTVKYKADSINNHVNILKEKGKKVQKEIDDKEAEIKKIKSESKATTEDDPLMKEALKALEESKEEKNNITEEIKASEKKVELYETLRSSYDKNTTTSGDENKN